MILVFENAGATCARVPLAGEPNLQLIDRHSMGGPKRGRYIISLWKHSPVCENELETQLI